MHLSSGHILHVRNYVATAVFSIYIQFHTTVPDIFISLLHFLLISCSNQ